VERIEFTTKGTVGSGEYKDRKPGKVESKNVAVTVWQRRDGHSIAISGEDVNQNRTGLKAQITPESSALFGDF
jgi:hypothetical protein